MKQELAIKLFDLTNPVAYPSVNPSAFLGIDSENTLMNAIFSSDGGFDFNTSYAVAMAGFKGFLTQDKESITATKASEFIDVLQVLARGAYQIDIANMQSLKKLTGSYRYDDLSVVGGNKLATVTLTFHKYRHTDGQKMDFHIELTPARLALIQDTNSAFFEFNLWLYLIMSSMNRINRGDKQADFALFHTLLSMVNMSDDIHVTIHEGDKLMMDVWRVDSRFISNASLPNAKV